VDVVPLRQTGSVNTSPDPGTIVPNAGLTGAAGWFDNGYIKFTSGALNGRAFEIKTWDGTNLKLFLGLPVTPAHNDSFLIEPGCNHLAGSIGDCQNKFNNIVNFRGEPFIPGMDSILNYPNAG
jgi:uncharacterized phage protein (TIGR02218 family)